MLKSIQIIAVSFFVSVAFAAEAETSGMADSAARNDANVIETSPLGQAVEKQLPTDEPFTPWVLKDDKTNQGDKLETKKVLDKETKTVKLQNVVPPIHFGSGEADIPSGYIDLLRKALDSVRDRKNVRLHFIGYTDNVRLFGAAKAKYGDNNGLSRERAGVAAEFCQQALHLPPESISYEGLGETHPVASNATEKGRAQNRRVEVEVWYDQVEEKLVDKEVLVSGQMNRVKVCRVETVCKLRYKEGHSKRARIKNLIPPLRFDDDSTSIPDDFLQKVRQAFANLRAKQNVTVKFIGYTDNTPLTGREERIYGNHLSLSKARARRVALAVQDALKLPSSAIDSDGKGSANPVASNDTESGRALNRRVEVEFWYDDMLQDLPDEPQLCPEDAGAETVTRVYDPPGGPIPAIKYENGKPIIPDGYAENLRKILDDLKDKTNARLRFIGYTSDERLDRRTAMVYGDDIGLSTSRARRAMEAIKSSLGLTDKQVEYEGRGFVQSDDVVNAGFVQSDTSRVEVQAVYDELASLDDTDSMEITRMKREVTPSDPFALNLMRITVDGKPVDDPHKSIPDVQRCTDVALDKADIQFKFDDLSLKPRLNVTAWPNSVRYQDDPNTEFPENLMRFRAYTNYPSFIARAEVRIFNADKSVRDTPLAVIPIGKDGEAEWQAHFDSYQAPGRKLQYVLRVYDKQDNFDETKPQAIWVVDKLPAELQKNDVKDELLVGYGENRLATENIPLNGGAIRVYGTHIPAGHSVFVAGRPVPVGKKGDFIDEEILPSGLHTVEVAVLDPSGNGDLFLRDLQLKKNDWFYVGIADVTASQSKTNGPAELVTNDKTHYDDDLAVDGRIAGYVNGKFGDNWRLTASADTLEGPVSDMFTNFTKKSPDALFRRINPEYYYPTFGDDGTVEETAPTLGKFYLKLKKDDDYGMWGNFKVGYFDNSLAHVDRDLYGANVHLQSKDATSFGEKRFFIDGFAAQPGTIAGRDEFRGTGGSLYYLKHQDILAGSDRVRIEVRDKVSGMVLAVKNLTPSLDYTIDYLQGRILLSSPLSGTASDNLLVDSGVGAGNDVYLVARYEFSTGFDDIKNFSNGGRIHYWFGDHVKVGVTTNNSDEPGSTSHLNAGDVTLRKSAESWIKVEKSASEGVGPTATNTLSSNDGGFTFVGPDPFGTPNVSAGAYRIDSSLGFGDVYAGAKGRATAYRQFVEGGYSAPGLITSSDTDQYGGTLTMPMGKKVTVHAKGDKKVQDQGLETLAEELDLSYQLNNRWNLASGVRNDSRTDHSPVVPLTQVQGDRTDAVVRATYDSGAKWLAYGYVQDTVNTTGNRESNRRVGSGGSYRVTDRFGVNGEASTGEQGNAAKLGTEYLYSDRTTVYLNYTLENERTDNGVRARRGNLTSGFKSHYSDTTSVYAEEKYTHGDVPSGLTHSAGVDLAPTDRWNFGANIDVGTLRDNQTGAKTDRKALGLKVGYGFETVRFASAFEYRIDDMQSTDLSTSTRTTWLVKNSLKYQIDPDWRFLGKLDHSTSTSTLGEFYDGTYTEAVAGYAYRPVSNDRLNTLLKYTYFYNVPAADQVTIANTAAAFIQKSHIFAVDTLYDLTPRWTIGGKYAYRLGQVSEDRVNREFFDSRAQLYIARADWHFIHRWDVLLEGRMLDLPDAKDRRSGALVAVYRQLGDNIKFGAGYNFTDFSDDLTDLSYNSQGVFINLIGSI